MQTDRQNKSLTKFVVYTRLLERLSLSIILAWLVFHNTVPLLSQVLIALLGALAIVYYLGAFRKLSSETSSARESFIFKVCHIALATITVSSLFTFMHWPSGDVLAIGGMGLCLMVIFTGFPYLKSGSTVITKPIMFRTILFLFIALYLIVQNLK